MGYKKPSFPGTSLVIRWLRLHAPTAVGTGSIPVSTAVEAQRPNLWITREVSGLNNYSTHMEYLDFHTHLKALRLKIFCTF